MTILTRKNCLQGNELIRFFGIKPKTLKSKRTLCADAAHPELKTITLDGTTYKNRVTHQTNLLKQEVAYFDLGVKRPAILIDPHSAFAKTIYSGTVLQLKPYLSHAFYSKKLLPINKSQLQNILTFFIISLRKHIHLTTRPTTLPLEYSYAETSLSCEKLERAFYAKKAVCRHYANAFALVLSKIVKANLVEAKSPALFRFRGTMPNDIAHAWLVLKTDDETFLIDPTPSKADVFSFSTDAKLIERSYGDDNLSFMLQELYSDDTPTLKSKLL